MYICIYNFCVEVFEKTISRTWQYVDVVNGCGRKKSMNIVVFQIQCMKYTQIKLS